MFFLNWHKNISFNKSMKNNRKWSKWCKIKREQTKTMILTFHFFKWNFNKAAFSHEKSLILENKPFICDVFLSPDFFLPYAFKLMMNIKFYKGFINQLYFKVKLYHLQTHCVTLLITFKVLSKVELSVFCWIMEQSALNVLNKT